MRRIGLVLVTACSTTQWWSTVTFTQPYRVWVAAESQGCVDHCDRGRDREACLSRCPGSRTEEGICRGEALCVDWPQVGQRVHQGRCSEQRLDVGESCRDESETELSGIGWAVLVATPIVALGLIVLVANSGPLGS